MRLTQKAKTVPSQNLPPLHVLIANGYKARKQRFHKAGISYQTAETKQRLRNEAKKAQDEKELQEYRALKRMEKENPIQAKAQMVAWKYFTSVKEIISDSRMHHNILARWEIFHYARKDLGYSYPRIAREMCMDHSTVYHGVGRYERLIQIRVHGKEHLMRRTDKPYLALLKIDMEAVNQ